MRISTRDGLHPHLHTPNPYPFHYTAPSYPTPHRPHDSTTISNLLPLRKTRTHTFPPTPSSSESVTVTELRLTAATLALLDERDESRDTRHSSDASAPQKLTETRDIETECRARAQLDNLAASKHAAPAPLTVDFSIDYFPPRLAQGSALSARPALADCSFGVHGLQLALQPLLILDVLDVVLPGMQRLSMNAASPTDIQPFVIPPLNLKLIVTDLQLALASPCKQV